MKHKKLEVKRPVDNIYIVTLTVTRTELEYLTTAVGGAAGPDGIGRNLLYDLREAGNKGGKSGNDEGMFMTMGAGHTQIEWRE